MYFPFVTSNVEYENVATLCVFSSHGDNIWKTLVRHECLTPIVLLILEGIVEQQFLFTLLVPSHIYGVIAWAGIVGAWKGGCLVGSPWV
jgi:hypothetical protein